MNTAIIPIRMNKAAEYLGVCRHTIYRMVQRGALKKYYSAGIPYLDLKEIQASFNEATQKAA